MTAAVVEEFGCVGTRSDAKLQHLDLSALWPPFQACRGEKRVAGFFDRAAGAVEALIKGFTPEAEAAIGSGAWLQPRLSPAAVGPGHPRNSDRTPRLHQRG